MKYYLGVMAGCKYTTCILILSSSVEIVPLICMEYKSLNWLDIKLIIIFKTSLLFL